MDVLAQRKEVPLGGSTEISPAQDVGFELMEGKVEDSEETGS